MDELFAVVGGGWHPLLVYPGGLTGLLLTFVLGTVWALPGAATNQFPAALPATAGALPAIACGLLLLALLPVPRSYWAYPIDLIVALALLELPYWLRLVSHLHASDVRTRVAATSQIGALLNVYVLLALAVAALGQASGSLLLPELKSGNQSLRWAGLAAWAIALPPLLAFGPWQVLRGRDWSADVRRVGHIGLLIALALPAGDQVGYGATAIAAAIAFVSLTSVHYLWRDSPERWERLQPLIALVLLVFMLRYGYEAWVARLR